MNTDQRRIQGVKILGTAEQPDSPGLGRGFVPKKAG
jgi:hypothetical protein